MNGKSLGICSRKTRTCFLTSGYSLTDNYSLCIGSCVRISKPPSQVSAGLSVPGRNSTSGTVFTSPSRARDLVTMVEGGHQDRSKRASDRFPGAQDGTQLAGQIGATYVMVRIRVHIYYRQFRQTIAYLLRKIWAVCRS